MTAVVDVQVFHGVAPGTGTDVGGSTLRMKRADNDTQDANDPVPIPEAGYAYSWRKCLRLVASSPPSNALRNLRFFTDGASLGTGRAILFARGGSYVQPSSADEDTPIGGQDAADLTSASPEVIVAGNFITDADVYPSDGGALQDTVFLQMRIGDDALAGAAAGALTCTYRFDET